MNERDVVFVVKSILVVSYFVCLVILRHMSGVFLGSEWSVVAVLQMLCCWLRSKQWVVWFEPHELLRLCYEPRAFRLGQLRCCMYAITCPSVCTAVRLLGVHSTNTSMS